MKLFYDEDMKFCIDSGKQFVIFLDNYFTQPKSIEWFCNKGAAVVDSAIFRQIWSPNELKTRINATLNDLY